MLLQQSTPSVLLGPGPSRSLLDPSLLPTAISSPAQLSPHPSAPASPAPCRDSPSPPPTVHLLMGPCGFRGRSGMVCLCPAGDASIQLDARPGDARCEDCEHFMHHHKSHRDYRPDPERPPKSPPAAAPPPQWQPNHDYCRREETVDGLKRLVLQHRVVQVRGTPTSGKSVLSQLLNSHIQSTEPHLIPVHITWRLRPHETVANVSWKQWLGVLSEHQLPKDFLDRNDVVLIIDEAQLSYASDDFWMQCVKYQAEPGRSMGPYIALFSSFGSADSTALHIEGSAPITLEQKQRVSLTPQPQMPHRISLCLTLLELRDVCARITRGLFSFAEDLVLHLYLLTNGHPGLCRGLLLSIIERPAVRPIIKAGGTVRLQHVADFFDSDSELFHCVEERVRRSLLKKAMLRDPAYPNLVDALREAIMSGGIITERLDAVPGLTTAYKLGYLQAEEVEEGAIMYSFPSLLHQRHCASLILPDDSDEIPFTTVKALCFDAISRFSPRQLEDHKRMAPHSAVKSAQTAVQHTSPPEAQFTDELYRCLYEATQGKCIIHSEFSYTCSGRLDLFLKGKSWGIEAIREGDRLREHLDRFTTTGKYGSWKLVKEWIVLDFRQSEPTRKPRHYDPCFFIVIFGQRNGAIESYRIWDSDHNEIVPPTPLLYR